MQRLFIVSVLVSGAACAFACASEETNPSTQKSGVAAPSNLSAAPMGTGIHLTWKDNSGDEAEYEVERREGAAAPFAKIGSVAFDVIQLHDTGVGAQGSYTYRVRAVSPLGGKSGYSNEVTAVAPASATGQSPGQGNPPGGGGTVPTWDGGAVSFTQHIVPLLQRSCGAASTSCHARDAYGASKDKACRGWLSLENASIGAKFYGGTVDGQSTGCPDRSLYARLTELDAWQEPGGKTRKYVKPGDPNASYLYNKIAGGPFGDDRPGVASAPMPTAAPLGATDLAMVKKWIESGAPAE